MYSIQKRLTIFTLLIVSLWGCRSGSAHLIADKSVRKTVSEKFEERKAQFLNNRASELLSVLDSASLKEREGLMFLYAYSTLSDLSNYDGEYFLDHVKYALMTRDSFAWGKLVSDADFLHFVLPPRVGSENLDSARRVFFRELLPRLRGMSMTEAALEVNHWCHERVVYQAADGRTSAPLATIKTGFGRCGEESVLTVTALRAVGIPARQIYTPRWAHQDDNHAWVEFWADGKWYYYGACEPEPDVNMGWFTEPARRTMLTATTTPGHYSSEYIINEEPNYTRLNQIDNYAKAKDLFVKVVDEAGSPVKGATVRFLLYNYAEFYPLAALKSDEKGFSHLRLGLGDILVWAGDDERFAYEKVTVKEIDTLVLSLSKKTFDNSDFSLDFIPPVAQPPFAVPDSKRAANNKRLAYEDSLRGVYEATFMNESRAMEFIQSRSVVSKELAGLLVKSRGNHVELCRVINEAESELAPRVVDILRVISEKDLRDARADVLLSHIRNTSANETASSAKNTLPSVGIDHKIWSEYLLNPRIGIEMMTPYKQELRPLFPADFWSEVSMDPKVAEKWIEENIKLVDDNENYIKVPSVPLGTYKMRAGDLVSRNILFVAICRTAGVAARIDQVTGWAQYYVHNEWVNVFEKARTNISTQNGAAQNDSVKKGIAHISLKYSGKAPCRYYFNFTLARFENGFFRTLEFEEGKDIKLFPTSQPLEPGYYMLVTGNRMGDGSVLANVSFFNLEGGSERVVNVVVRTPENSVKPVANIKLPDFITRMDGSKVETGQAIRTYGAIAMIWIDPGKEPSRHVLNDLALMKNSFDESLLPFVFLVPQEKLTDTFRPESYVLPANSIFANSTLASESDILTQLEKNLHSNTTTCGTSQKSNLSSQLPVVILVNARGEVLYFSSGYKIGTCEQLLKSFGSVSIKK
ncbi:MAG: transglutaminase domain-containing protein [Bacteroidales bacterium]|jgi:transglutaminase-like putative cysteine protease